MRRLGDPSSNRLGIKTVPWGLGRSGVAFLPTDIPGLEFWVAADRGLTLNNGDPVALWPDQSGNGNDLTAPAPNRPTFRTAIIGGKPVVRANGVDERMSVTFGVAIAQPYTVCFVGKFVNLDLGGAAFRVFISGIGADLYSVFRTPNAAPDLEFFAGAGVNTGDPADLIAHIYTIVFNGAGSFMRKDGVQIGAGNPGANAGGGVTVFSDRDPAFTFPSNYDHAEVCFYSAELIASEIDQWEVYASSKYGIAI